MRKRLSKFINKPKNQAVIYIIAVLFTYFYFSRPLGDAVDILAVNNLAYLASGKTGVRVVDISQDGEYKEVSGFNTSGFAAHLLLEGNLIFVADGKSGLQILDTSTPSSIKKIGQLDTEGYASDLVLIGKNIFVADGEKGVQIIDVSTPGAPIYQGNIDGYETSVIGSKDHFIFIGDNKRRIIVFDVSNPIKPKMISEFEIPSDARDIQIVGSVAFVADGKAGLLLIDISNPLNLKLESSLVLKGETTSVTPFGNLAYVTTGSQIRVVDISDAKNPHEIGDYQVSGSANKVAISSGKAFIAAGKNGMEVVYIQPELDLGFISTPAMDFPAQAVEKIGEYAYIAAGQLGLKIAHVNDFSKPTLVGGLNTVGFANNITIYGNRAIISDRENGLVFVDIANPSAPSLLPITTLIGRDSYDVELIGGNGYLADGTFGIKTFVFFDENTPVEIGELKLAGVSKALRVIGDYAYVAGGNAGLQVVNIQEPKEMKLVGSYSISGDAKAVDLVAINDTLASESNVDRYTVNLTHPDTKLYAFLAFNDIGLQILDVTVPESPQLVGSIDVGTPVNDVKVVRNLVYLATSDKGLLIIDASNLTAPVQIGQLSTFSSGNGLDLEGTTAFIATTQNALQIVNVSNVSEPVEIGALNGTTTSLQSVYQSGYLYSANGKLGVDIFDVNDIGQPKFLTSMDTSGGANFVKVNSSLAYIADGIDGVKVFNVNNLLSPQYIGSIDTPGYSNAIELFGSKAYVADGDAGVRILDISNPANIIDNGQIAVNGSARRLMADGHNLFVAAGNGGLSIVDINNPLLARVISVYTTIGEIRSVAIRDNYAYLAAGNAGLQVLDISNTLNPKLIFAEDNPVYSEDLYIYQNFLLVANKEYGYEIFDISEPGIPKLVSSSNESHNAVGISSDIGFLNEDDIAKNLLAVFVSDNEFGLKIFDAEKRMGFSYAGAYELPGMATPEQVADYVKARISGDKEGDYTRAARTVRQIFIDILILWFGGLVIWIALLGQFVLPTRDLSSQYALFRRLLGYITGSHGMAIHVKEGKVIQKPGETNKKGPGIAIVDSSSAIVLEKRAGKIPKERQSITKKLIGNSNDKKLINTSLHKEKVRVEGPGIVFIGQESRNSFKTVDEKYRGVADLRTQFRKRPQVHAYTNDGIEVITDVYVVFSIGEKPDVLRVAYIGEMKPQNLQIIHIKEKNIDDAQNPGQKKLTQVIDRLEDVLEIEQKTEIHRYVQSSLHDWKDKSNKLQDPVKVTAGEQKKNAHTSLNYFLDRDRIFAAISAQAQDVYEDKFTDWTELPPHVAVEVFRDVISEYSYEYLYKPIDPTEWPLESIKKEFANKVRNLGVLSYQFAFSTEGDFLKVGMEWDNEAIELLPVQNFTQPNVLRARGVKVITAGFSELIPVDPGVREGLLDNWRARWQRDAEIITAAHDLTTIRIEEKEKETAIAGIISYLSKILKSDDISEETQLIQILQALDNIAADEKTSKLIPFETLKVLDKLHAWLIDNIANPRNLLDGETRTDNEDDLL